MTELISQLSESSNCSRDRVVFRGAGRPDLPILVDRLELTGAEQAALAADGGVPDGCADMIELLLREPLPFPEPHVPYADVRNRLSDCYRAWVKREELHEGSICICAKRVAAWAYPRENCRSGRRCGGAERTRPRPNRSMSLAGAAGSASGG
jgi:hypothetical protein